MFATPDVPPLRLSKKQPHKTTGSNALPFGGNFARCQSYKAKGKVVSHPQVFDRAPRKILGSQQSNIFAPPPPKREQTSSRGKQLHTDPFAAERQLHSPVRKLVSAPIRKPVVSAMRYLGEPKRAEEKVVTVNGVHMPGGKRQCRWQADANHQVMDQTPAPKSATPLRETLQRFHASPAHHAAAWARPSEGSKIEPSVPHIKVFANQKSLDGVFKTRAVTSRDFAYRPPWHTTTPRAAAKEHRVVCPYATHTPTRPSVTAGAQ